MATTQPCIPKKSIPQRTKAGPVIDTQMCMLVSRLSPLGNIFISTTLTRHRLAEATTCTPSFRVVVRIMALQTLRLHERHSLGGHHLGFWVIKLL